jgi:hypothetical protein
MARIVWAVLTLSTAPLALRAAVTLDSNDAWVLTNPPTGDLTLTGDLSVVKGIDFGMAADNPALAAVQLNYFGATAKTAMFDLSDALGTVQWRDNLTTSARDKMTLDGSNVLTLWKSDGTGAGILLNPNNGQINLTGTSPGLLAGGTPVFTLGATGNLIFGSQPLNLPGLTAASSSSTGVLTGALTVAGGIGVAKDSYINGIRIGRGGGDMAVNTAYGVNVLQANSSGTGNCGFGYQALAATTTGCWNTATGYMALANATHSGSNVATGYMALASGSWCYSNTASGTHSMRYTASGSYNTAAGAYSLENNIKGSYNTALGYYALSHITTGQNNVAIGSWAGSQQANQSIDLATTNASVYIGAGCRGYSNLDSNSIVIGAYAIGEGPNSTVIGNASTTNTHLYGTVNASAMTVNNVPVLTASYGTGNKRANGALLAIGTYNYLDQPDSIAIGSYTRASRPRTLVLGYGTVAGSAYATTMGSYNLSSGSAISSLNDTSWLEESPLFELGNGNPTAAYLGRASNAITTLKNGRTTLTNKEWKIHSEAPLADPDASTDSGGDALVVEGHTRLRGKVIIEQAQGDISMGIYGP